MESCQQLYEKDLVYEYILEKSKKKRAEKIQNMKDKGTGLYGEDFRRYSQLTTIKARAEKNGIPFDIKHTDIEWPTHCPIFGVELSRGDDRNNSPSVDRILPEVGYVKGNVRIISKLANSMKQNATREELETFCKNILDYMDGKI